jgi:nucleoside-diphosphate-sugar epimerase
MKVLLTGVLGHIGSSLINDLIKLNKIKTLYLVDCLEFNKINSIFNLKNENKNIKFFDLDLSKKKSFLCLPKADICIHLASFTNVVDSFSSKDKIYKNNFDMFCNIKSYCEKKNVKLIHISSTSVYGLNNGFLDEGFKNLKPESPYAEIKLKEEILLNKNKNNNKLKYITLRFGTISGISKGMRFHTAVNKFCLASVLHNPIPIWNNAINQYRPYLSLRDAKKVIIFILKKNLFNNNTYNAFTANLTVKNILGIIKKYIRNVKVINTASNFSKSLSYKLDKSKITKLGLNLNSKIEKDIKDTINLLKFLK